TNRGITESTARKLLANLAEGQQVIEQLERGDYMIKQAPGNFRNPPSFHLYLIKENVSVPEDFETRHKRDLREEDRAQRASQELEQMKLETEYNEYLSREVDRYIDTEQGQLDYERLVEAKKTELRTKHKYALYWESETIAKLAQSAARSEIRK